MKSIFIQQIQEEKTQESSSNKNGGSSGSSSSQDQEISQIIKKYSEYKSFLKIKQGEMIGQGGNGVVYKGLDQLKGEFLAFKSISLFQKAKDTPGGSSSVFKKKQLKNIIKELDIFIQLQHPHIIKFKGI